MKKMIILGITSLIFAMQHGSTDDKDLKLALEGKYKEALSGFIKRCENNDGYACGMAGYFYDKGFGTKKDHSLAIKFYKKGCKLNDADSCTLLAYEYNKKNKTKAYELLNKACKLGNKDACKYKEKIK